MASEAQILANRKDACSARPWIAFRLGMAPVRMAKAANWVRLYRRATWLWDGPTRIADPRTLSPVTPYGINTNGLSCETNPICPLAHAKTLCGRGGSARRLAIFAKAVY